MLQLDKISSYKAQDKRRSPRKASLIQCVVEKCFSRNGKITARTLNSSATGFMLEMDYPLSPGDAIKIQFASDADEVRAFGKSCCLGMVRWCKPQEGSCGGFYGVGVELANQAPRRQAYY
jgi:hypothetical protein